SLLKAMDDELYLMDVADIQLKATHKKLAKNDKKRLLCARMNAESLAYADHAFATVLIFFLFHELPSDARQRSISEAIRVLRPGGRIVIAEYGACPKKHFLWRFLPSRCVLQKLEPFLESFWNLDLTETLLVQAKKQGKAIKLVDAFYCFSSFYRVLTYELNEQPRDAQGGCKYEPETSN
ncbi:MAG TPA: class I SAM-dependent methyltransferase, partial [Candidatus Tenderia electrophaga]|nr:class I SAM-dependent methyltransferase [Candidatus Tenderia electrophaga]